MKHNSALVVILIGFLGCNNSQPVSQIKGKIYRLVLALSDIDTGLSVRSLGRTEEEK